MAFCSANIAYLDLNHPHRLYSHPYPLSTLILQYKSFFQFLDLISSRAGSYIQHNIGDSIQSISITNNPFQHLRIGTMYGPDLISDNHSRKLLSSGLEDLSIKEEAGKRLEDHHKGSPICYTSAMYTGRVINLCRFSLSAISSLSTCLENVCPRAG